MSGRGNVTLRALRDYRKLWAALLSKQLIEGRDPPPMIRSPPPS